LQRYFIGVLFYAVASPTALKLAAGVFFAASGKTGLKPFGILNGLDELLFGVSPGIFEPQAPCFAFYF